VCAAMPALAPGPESAASRRASRWAKRPCARRRPQPQAVPAQEVVPALPQYLAARPERADADRDYTGGNLRAHMLALLPTVRDIFESFGFRTQIDRLAKAGLGISSPPSSRPPTCAPNVVTNPQSWARTPSGCDCYPCLRGSEQGPFVTVNVFASDRTETVTSPDADATEVTHGRSAPWAVSRGLRQRLSGRAGRHCPSGGSCDQHSQRALHPHGSCTCRN
jgi:hypothetical protein